MKNQNLIEWLVVVAIIAIIATTVVGALYGVNRAVVGPDGELIYRVQIDGHDYLKTGNNMTHSASCAACTQKEK